MDSAVIGHKAIRDQLKKLYTNKTLPHAVLFSGPEGVGKFQVASELFRTYFCESNSYGGCLKCKDCRLYADKSLPNYYYINASIKESCSVDAIRKLLYSLHLSVAHGQQRVVVIDNAEHLSHQSQNVLLKALEEPRTDTFFCLISSSPARILSTIVSRCQTWFFNSLNENEVETILRTSFKDRLGEDTDLLALARIADGSLSYIEQITTHSDSFEQVGKLITSIKEKNISKAFKIIESFKDKKASMNPYFAALRIIARDEMVSAEHPNAKRAWSIFLANSLEAERLILERNLSIELVMGNLALSLIRPVDESSATTSIDSANLLESLCL